MKIIFNWFSNFQSSEDFSLLFFFGGSPYYSFLTIKNSCPTENKIKSYYGPEEVSNIAEETMEAEIVVFGSSSSVKVNIPFVEKKPLGINLYLYENGKKRLYGTATCFEQGKRYHLFVFAIAEKQMIVGENASLIYESFGTVSFELGNVVKPNVLALPSYRFFDLQMMHIMQIVSTTNRLNNLNISYNFDECGKVFLSTFKQCTRTLALVFAPTILKWIPIPKQKQTFVSMESSSMEEYINNAMEWIYTEKGYSADHHFGLLDQQQEVKTDMWKSLFLQDTGNCKDQALTMYQFIKNKDPKAKVALASVIIRRNSVPHCICLLLEEGSSSSPSSSPRVTIVDSTRKKDLEDINYNPDDYYLCAVSMFCEDQTYFIYQNNQLGVSLLDLTKGNYSLRPKFTKEELKWEAEHTKKAYLYNLDI